MSAAPTLIREEVADLLSRVAAHAQAGAVHAGAGTDALLAAEIRCAASTLMCVARLIEHLRPDRQKPGGRAA